MIRHYDLGSMTWAEVRNLEGKLVTVDTWSDEETGEFERHFPRVRTMLMGRHIMLLLADGESGPPDQVYIDLIRAVEVHDSSTTPS
jgi:hypothetical protein